MDNGNLVLLYVRETGPHSLHLYGQGVAHRAKKGIGCAVLHFRTCRTRRISDASAEELPGSCRTRDGIGREGSFSDRDHLFPPVVIKSMIEQQQSPAANTHGGIDLEGEPDLPLALSQMPSDVVASRFLDLHDGLSLRGTHTERRHYLGSSTLADCRANAQNDTLCLRIRISAGYHVDRKIFLRTKGFQQIIFG